MKELENVHFLCSSGDDCIVSVLDVSVLSVAELVKVDSQVYRIAGISGDRLYLRIPPGEKKMEYSFMELPGMAFANIDGEVRPCNDEARKALRTRTFEQMLFGGPKRQYTQADYEEIENEFSTRG